MTLAGPLGPILSPVCLMLMFGGTWTDDDESTTYMNDLHILDIPTGCANQPSKWSPIAAHSSRQLRGVMSGCHDMGTTSHKPGSSD